jgi:trehalose 6-phosphate phosphatase
LSSSGTIHFEQRSKLMRADPGARTTVRASGHKSAVPHLFQDWERICECLRGAKRVALFLDFDGTLVPFADRPGDVRLAPTTRRLLRRLANHPRVCVTILSGRRRADIIERIHIRGVQYLGLYGWERGARPILSGETMALLRVAHRTLAQSLQKYRGVRMEDKEYMFAIHFRGAAAATVRRAFRALRKSLRSLASPLRIVPGEKVWEIVPPQVQGKGAAIRRALQFVAGPSLPIFVGDTLADEEAFAELKKGITIQVGRPRRTFARYRLRNPREVEIFLARLAEALP